MPKLLRLSGKGWADYARDYNALVVSWAGIGEVAAAKREAAASGDATQQQRLFDTERCRCQKGS